MRIISRRPEVVEDPHRSAVDSLVFLHFSGAEVDARTFELTYGVPYSKVRADADEVIRYFTLHRLGDSFPSGFDFVSFMREHKRELARAEARAEANIDSLVRKVRALPGLPKRALVGLIRSTRRFFVRLERATRP